MIRKFAEIFLTLLFSTGVLLFSVFKSASVKYVFAGPEQTPTPRPNIEVSYELPKESEIGPDSPFWPLAATRDRLWLITSLNSSKKSELNLLFADKRLISSESLFENDQANLGYSTLTKSEKYLQNAYFLEEEARAKGENTNEALYKISLASLKHSEIVDKILTLAPDDAKPNIINTMNYSKNIYKDSRSILLEKGINPPENPFNWE